MTPKVQEEVGRWGEGASLISKAMKKIRAAMHYAIAVFHSIIFPPLSQHPGIIKLFPKFPTWAKKSGQVEDRLC